MSDNNGNWLDVEYKGQYTEQQFIDLNIELEDTPEIRAFFQKAADMALMESAQKEVDERVAPVHGPDLERELYTHYPLLEEYISVSKEREPFQAIWEGKRYRRNTWWSLFHEEMDYNWMELDLFDIKLNKRLSEVEPTFRQWEQAKKIRSMIIANCKRLTTKRWDITNHAFTKAMEATKECRAFWATDAGKKLNELNERRSTLWTAISELNITFEDYNNLIGTEFNKYWTTGDTEEVDTMELMANTVYEMMDMLEDASHEEDSAYHEAESGGPAFWNKVDAARSWYKARLQQADWEAEEEYRRAIAEIRDAEERYQMGSANHTEFFSFL